SHRHFAGPGFGVDFDFATRRSVLHGVVEQVLQDFAQEARIGANRRKIRRNVSFDDDAFALCAEQSGLGAQVNHVSDAYGAKLNLELSSFDAGELCGMVANNFQKAAVVLVIFEGTAEEGFGEALNRRERSLEFVRDVGDEILAHAFEAAQLGNVMQYDDGTGRFFANS